MAVDRIDRRIIGILQHHGRISWRELADAVHMAASSVADRVRRLEAAGVIRGYRAGIDPAALGRNVRAVIDVSLPCRRRPGGVRGPLVRTRRSRVGPVRHRPGRLHGDRRLRRRRRSRRLHSLAEGRRWRGSDGEQVRVAPRNRIGQDRLSFATSAGTHKGIQTHEGVPELHQRQLRRRGRWAHDRRGQSGHRRAVRDGAAVGRRRHRRRDEGRGGGVRRRGATARRASGRWRCSASPTPSRRAPRN